MSDRFIAVDNTITFQRAGAPTVIVPLKNLQVIKYDREVQNIYVRAEGFKEDLELHYTNLDEMLNAIESLASLL